MRYHYLWRVLVRVENKTKNKEERCYLTIKYLCCYFSDTVFYNIILMPFTPFCLVFDRNSLRFYTNANWTILETESRPTFWQPIFCSIVNILGKFEATELWSEGIVISFSFWVVMLAGSFYQSELLLCELTWFHLLSSSFFPFTVFLKHNLHTLSQRVALKSQHDD